jgi:hypothetical protein
LNDPDTTYPIGPFAFPKEFFVFDSHASSFWHALLIVAAFAAALAAPRRNLKALIYASLMVAGFVAFCAALRWQHWHSRIHLPWLVALMPFVAVVFAARSRRVLVRGATVIVALCGAYCVVNNRSRPLHTLEIYKLPREQQYVLMHAKHLSEPLAQASADIAASRCRHVGLKLQFDDFEYPIWVTLRNRGFTGRIDHVAVEDASGSIPSSVPLPDAVVTTYKGDPPAEIIKAYPYRTDYGALTVLWAVKPATSQAVQATLSEASTSAL